MNPQAPATNMMQAISLEEIVKQSIYYKYLEADKLLQNVDSDKRTLDAATKRPKHGRTAEFKAAVLAEYRLIRPKLSYANKITKDPEEIAAFKTLYELDKFILDAALDERVQPFIKAHLTIGLFLEKDGVTKYERVFHPLGSVMLH